MNPKTPAIRTVPVSAITILNPRARNRRIFQELVTSIAHLGLKKPNTVAERPDGTHGLIEGTYQSPILVQWQRAPRQTRVLEVTLTEIN